jgi:hypothetical protein
MHSIIEPMPLGRDQARREKQQIRERVWNLVEKKKAGS